MAFGTPIKPFVQYLDLSGDTEIITFDGTATYLRVDNLGPGIVSIKLNDSQEIWLGNEITFEFPSGSMHVNKLTVSNVTSGGGASVLVVAGVC